MNITELREELEAEILRAEKFRDSYDETLHFYSQELVNEYIRGGNEALKGVVKMLRQMEADAG